MYRTLRRRASVVFTVSEYTRTELLRLTAGPRQDNIIPTHLGVSPEWYRARERLPIRRRPYFVAVGNVKPYKNIGRLVDAFLQVQQHIPHDLVIIGQSESLITGESPQFFERVRSGGDRIQMTGFVPQDELLSLVAHATAIFVPSLCEGFGLPPLEAMAAGVPAAVARAGSLPEVCADAAVYFDPLNVDEIAKSLVQMATDATLCKQLSEEGLKRSRTFTWASCARRTAQELRACLDMG